MRLLTTVVVALALPVLASAQLGSLLVPFAPKDCMNDARNAVGGSANNPRLITLLNAGVEVPLGQETIDLGMSLSDGKARAWYYVFIAGPQDTVASVAMVRAVFACQDPSALAGGAIDTPPLEDFPAIPLPGTYVEGQQLANAIAGNDEYKKFKAVYPDSMPGFTVLTTSTEDALGFPTGTPFWILNWSDVAGGGIPGEPFLCLVHAVTGQTLCGDQITLSVEELRDPTVFLAPNPVRDNAMLNLPASWIGKPVIIEAVNTSGDVVNVASIPALASPVFTFNAGVLASGAYTLRARTESAFIVLPMSVVR